MTDFEKSLEMLVKTRPARRPETENGEYKAYISKVEAKENEKGTHWLSIKCEMEDEQYVFVNFFFTVKSVEISFQKLEELAREFDVSISREEFYQGKMNYLISKFSFLEGEMVDLKILGEIGKRNYLIKKVLNNDLCL